MCIRDRSDFRAVKVKECVAVPKSKKLLQFTLDDGTVTDRTMLSGIHAVSYTHLDVYKRQDICSKTKLLLSVYRDVVWITLSESARVNEELVYYGEEPVSYTHLDVYKRQPMPT